MELFRNKRILLVVAHPDDELLGPGAAMNRLINEAGVTARVIILGEGITSRSDQRDTDKWSKELEQHKRNILAAQKAIGYEMVKAFDFPDNRFDTVALLDIIKLIEKEKQDFQPDIIFTHHGGDVNIDHQRCFEAVVTACRPMNEETVKMIFTFETASGTEWRASTDPRHFIPNFYIKVSEQNMEAKIRAMESYEFEKRPFPHPRSPEALRAYARYRGITVGHEYAEAFCLVRAII